MSLDGDENPEKLVVAMSTMIHPMQAMGQDGKYYGIFYDLVSDMADAFGKKLEIIRSNYSTSITDLRARQYDILSFMMFTPERQKVVDFTIPCGRMSISFMTRKGFPLVEDVKQLNDSRVRMVVMKGSYPESVAFKQFPKDNIVSLLDVDSAILEVVQGKSDVIFLPTIMAHEVSKKYPGQVQVYYQSFLLRDISLVVRKTEEKKFLNTINAFLTDYIESGKMRFLGDKYFSELKAEFAKQGQPWNFVF